MRFCRLVARAAQIASLGLALCIGVAVREARCDTPISAADKDTARELMSTGNKAFEAGDFQKALESFSGAHAIMNLPTTGLGVMRSQEKLGLLVEARDIALAITRIAEKANEPKPERDAREEARKLGESLASRIPTVEVKVDGVDPKSSFTVSVDGVELPAAAATLPRKVNPGVHQVLVRARGYVDNTQSVTLAEGQTGKAPATMVRDPNVPLEPVVELPKPEPKPEPKPLPPPIAPVAPEKHGIHPLLYAGIATTGVGVVLGTVTGIAVLAEKKDCVTNPKVKCPIALANVSNVGFAVAGVGGVLTIVGIVLSVSPSSEPAKKAFVAPQFGPGYLGLHGAF